MRPKHQLKWLLIVLLAVGCQQQNTSRTTLRSAYYWSTEWRAGPRVMEQTKGLDRLYLRFFDVVLDRNGEPMPNATLRFSAKLPRKVEVVPVVFIVNDVMKNVKNTDELAGKVLRRILQISETHDIEVKEVQIDCDWTLTSRRNYRAFLSQLRRLAAAKQLALSATIRLHQLSQPVPPVDKGVLMMYNTGDFTDLRCEHPILDLRDVVPYLKYLSGYRLPLSPAYPLFSYRLLFRNGHYKGVLHADNDLPVLPGDSVIERKVSMGEVLKVKQTIEEIRPDLKRETIIYDFSPNHIANYKPRDYEEIYRSH